MIIFNMNISLASILSYMHGIIFSMSLVLVKELQRS